MFRSTMLSKNLLYAMSCSTRACMTLCVQMIPNDLFYNLNKQDAVVVVIIITTHTANTHSIHPIALYSYLNACRGCIVLRSAVINHCQLCSLALLLLLQIRTEVGVNVPKLELSCCNVAWSCHTDANNPAAELQAVWACSALCRTSVDTLCPAASDCHILFRLILEDLLHRFAAHASIYKGNVHIPQRYRLLRSLTKCRTAHVHVPLQQNALN